MEYAIRGIFSAVHRCTVQVMVQRIGYLIHGAFRSSMDGGLASMDGVQHFQEYYSRLQKDVFSLLLFRDQGKKLSKLANLV